MITRYLLPGIHPGLMKGLLTVAVMLTLYVFLLFFRCSTAQITCSVLSFSSIMNTGANWVFNK